MANGTGYLVQLQTPEGDNAYPIIAAEAFKDANGNTFNLTAMKEEFESLKTSVSNGKSLIASAITDKGVSTASDATFQTMADNIAAIKVGNCEIHEFTEEFRVLAVDCGYVVDDKVTDIPLGIYTTYQNVGVVVGDTDSYDVAWSGPGTVYRYGKFYISNGQVYVNLGTGNSTGDPGTGGFYLDSETLTVKIELSGYILCCYG